jgi:hypothetical protein
MSDVDFSIVLKSVLGVDRYEVGRIGESFHDHPYDNFPTYSVEIDLHGRKV